MPVRVDLEGAGLGDAHDPLGEVALIGNLPTVEVMANGTPENVRNAVSAALAGMEDTSRILLSCGGGMPPDVPSEDIEAVLSAV